MGRSKWRFLPVEALLAAAIAAVLLTTLVVPGIPSATRIHLVMALCLVLAVARLLPVDDPGPVRWLRDFFPIIPLLTLFEGLGDVIPAVNPASHDAVLAMLDTRLVGPELQRALVHLRMSWPAADLLTLAYASFFILPLIFLASLIARRDPWRHRFLLATVLTFLISYAGYIMVPASGPRFFDGAAAWQSLPQGVIGGHLRGVLDILEHNRFDAFPSGHTMVTLVVLWAVWYRRRRWFPVYFAAGALLIAATVLLQYHYVVDVIVGALLAPLGPVVACRRRVERPPSGP